MPILELLTWSAWIGAGISLIIYVYAYVLRPRGDRLLSTMGLFFTAVGLSQIPLFMLDGARGPGFMNAGFCIISFLAAAAAQAIVAVRSRRRIEDSVAGEDDET